MPPSPPSTGSEGVVVSVLTPPGRGALAVVGVAGGRAAAIVDRLFAGRGGRSVAAREDGSIVHGAWRATGEDVVAVRRGADVVEVHCHGGVAAAAAVTASLVAVGAEEVPWAAWLAAAGAKETVVEAYEALAGCGGPKAARILAHQAAGGLDAAIGRIHELVAAGQPAAAAIARDGLLRAARVGLRLVRPWRVVVAGPVNAGKSSLVNALAGHARSIVTPEPGTTRDLVTTRVVLDGWEVELIDTAGLRGEGAESGPVERAGIARAEAAVVDADLVLRVCPADTGPPPAPTPEEIAVVSKIDLVSSARGWPADAVRTSAATGAGIADLNAAIIGRLVPEERTDPDLLKGAVPFTTRQIALIEGLPLPREPALPSSAAMDGGAQTASSERRPRRP